MNETRKSRRPGAGRVSRPKLPAARGAAAQTPGRTDHVLMPSQSHDQMRLRIVTLEADLDRERRERAEEADVFSRMLLKVTEAEEEARTLRARVAQLENALAGKGPTEKILSDHLTELREVMSRVAEIFDELDRREAAIAEFRSRGLQDARDILRRAAAAEKPKPRPPPIPEVDREDVDISEMAEIVQSLRPPKP